MVHHIIIWKIKDECRDKADEIKANAKRELEGLLGQIDGMSSMKIQINGLPSSTGDLMLDAVYESEAALKAYSAHPKHVHVANTFVRPFMQLRMCYDYED